MAQAMNDLTDGPVTKPHREPKESTRPAPRPSGPTGGTPPPAPPRPAPRPAPAPTPTPDDPIGGPIFKPRPTPPEPKAPETIPGPIGARWRELGGTNWATPTHQTMGTGDGRGRYVSFQNKNGTLLTIMHTPQTGARVIWGELNTAWGRYGGHGGFLGYPTSDQQTAHDGVGQFQTFEGGYLLWHPSIGTRELHGDILTRYLQLGGSRFGYPFTDETGTPDGRARFNHFREFPSGAEKSIYWTPQNKAHELVGVIRQSWIGYRGKVQLGYPTSGEMLTHDRVGRYQSFENCTYVWHPQTGAHEVHGAIRDRYNALGGSAFGYPTTDETRTPNGKGVFNHFREMPSGADKSIYSTAQHGANEVYGLIRSRWAEYRWESGKMGFPTGHEVSWPEGGPGARQQSFEGGRMIYSAQKNVAAPDPVDFFHDFGDAPGVDAIEGWVSTKVYWDGRVENRGHMRATGADSYHFTAQTLLSTGTTALAAGWKGHVGGTFDDDPRSEDWAENGINVLVTENFWELQRASYQADRHYRGAITGALADIAGAALKFIIGATTLATPGGAALVIVVGGLAASVAKDGDLAAGAKVIGGTLWLAGPFGTLYALAAEGIAAIGHDSRGLRDEEWDIAKRVFGTATPPRDRVRITDTVGAGDRAFVFPRFDGVITLNLGKEGYTNALTWKKGFSKTRNRNRPYGEAFIHEMVHAWQLHHGSNLGFITSAMTKVAGEEYGYTPGKDYGSYALEPQATIVEDWYGRNYTEGVAAEDFGLASQKAMTDPLFRYISQNLRTGKGA